MDPEKVDIHPEWKELLKEEFQKPYFDELRTFLYKRKSEGVTIYPPGPNIFEAFNRTPPSNLKAVIIGQDPYHGPGQAMGLSFSVPTGKRVPPSLVNIYKELKEDLGCTVPDHGDLRKWADQGVLLLNAILTVERGKAGAHRTAGWMKFTDAAIKNIAVTKKHLVFLLWGNFAKQKALLIDPEEHLILKSSHPSPFSVHRFYGCRHFSKANQYLVSKNKEPIDWNLC